MQRSRIEIYNLLKIKLCYYIISWNIFFAIVLNKFIMIISNRNCIIIIIIIILYIYKHCIYYIYMYYIIYCFYSCLLCLVWHYYIIHASDHFLIINCSAVYLCFLWKKKKYIYIYNFKSEIMFKIYLSKFLLHRLVYVYTCSF